MKNLKLITLLAALMAFVTAVHAQVGFSVQGITTAGTNSWAVVPGVAGAQIQVLSVHGISDKATANITFYTNGPGLTVFTNTQGTTNIPCNSSLTNGDVVVILGSTNNYWSRHAVYAATGTNFTVDSPPTNNIGRGSIVFKMAAAAPGGAFYRHGPVTNTLSPAGGPVFTQPNSLRGGPVLIQLDSTSAGSLGTVSGQYR